MPQNSLHIFSFRPFFLKLLFGFFFGLILLSAQATLARPVPHSFADLAEQIKGAVVNITVKTKGQSSSELTIPIVPEGSPFQDFFDDFFSQNPQSRAQTAIGSGFVISSDGYIVTNDHVIKDADEIEIEFYSGETLSATLVGSDPNTDIALLKLTPNAPLEFVEFGDSDAARVGDWVMAVGNPLGQGFSVSVGIISARNRELSGAYDDFIQTDAAINQGNSGGPLFNLDGEVIGVNTAILSPNGGSIGIGFSMSSAVVSHVIHQLKSFGETRRGWLGVQIQDLSPELASSWGIEAEGVIVSAVLNGPARGAGIEVGDVIIQFDGKDVLDSRTFVRMVGAAKANQTVELALLRKGVRQDLSVTLTRREENERQAMNNEPKKTEPQLINGLGLSLTPLTEEIRQEIGFAPDEPGLLVGEVEKGSVSANAGLRPGTILLTANNHPLHSIGDLMQEIDGARAANRNSIALLIQEQAGRVFIALPLPE